MGYYLLTEKECNELTNNILSGLDAVRTMDEWVCDEAVELLSDSLVILDNLQEHTGVLKMENDIKTSSNDQEVKAIEAKVEEKKVEAPKEVVANSEEKVVLAAEEAAK